MTWNYRVIKQRGLNDETDEEKVLFTVYAVGYKNPEADELTVGIDDIFYTGFPLVIGNDVEAIRRQLKGMLEGLDKPILVEDEGESS